MDLNQLPKISEAEWQQAINYALYRLSSFYDIKLFPGGQSHEDIIYAAIGNLIHPEKEYNSKYNLGYTLWLKALGIASNLIRLSEHKKRKHITEEADGTIDFEDCCELPSIVDSDNFTEELYDEINGDEELELVTMSILDDGAKKADEIAEDTGIPKKRIYELKRKLGTRIRKVQERLTIGKKMEAMES